MAATYRLEQLTVHHLATPAGGEAALHALDLVVEQGEQLALIGPSGAGKTTLLATLACAHQPTSGSLAVLGVDPWALSQAARHALRAPVPSAANAAAAPTPAGGDHRAGRAPATLVAVAGAGVAVSPGRTARRV
jgi:phosphonate transport system ATP-binding protein